MADRLTETEKALVARIRADKRYVESSVRRSTMAEMTDEEYLKRRNMRKNYLAGLTAHERRIYYKFKERNNLKIRTHHPEMRDAFEDLKTRMKFKKYILELVRDDSAFREELRAALLTPTAPGPPGPTPEPPPEYSAFAAAAPAAAAAAEHEEYEFSSDD